MKISSPQYESEKSNKVNNELKLNVDEQQDDIKHLKEQCNIDDEDEVQKITAARNPIQKIRLCMWHVIEHLQWKLGW